MVPDLRIFEKVLKQKTGFILELESKKVIKIE